MDHKRNNKIDAWDEAVYGTGRTEPPKSNSGIVALLMIIIIFLSGIISGLSFMNVQLFHQLQQTQVQSETIPMAFSAMEAEASLEDDLLEDVYSEEAVRIELLGLTGEYISSFDQHYFNWPAGMLVTMVDDSGKAYTLGLRAGDILTGINGAPITSQAELDAFFAAGIPKGPLTVTVHRDGNQLTFEEIK